MSLKPLPPHLGLGVSRIGSFNNPARLSDSERTIVRAIAAPHAEAVVVTPPGAGDPRVGEALLAHPAGNCSLAGGTSRKHLRSAAALMAQAGS